MSIEVPTYTTNHESPTVEQPTAGSLPDTIQHDLNNVATNGGIDTPTFQGRIEAQYGEQPTPALTPTGEVVVNVEVAVAPAAAPTTVGETTPPTPEAADTSSSPRTPNTDLAGEQAQTSTTWLAPAVVAAPTVAAKPNEIATPTKQVEPTPTPRQEASLPPEQPQPQPQPRPQTEAVAHVEASSQVPATATGDNMGNGPTDPHDGLHSAESGDENEGGEDREHEDQSNEDGAEDGEGEERHEPQPTSDAQLQSTELDVNERRSEGEEAAETRGEQGGDAVLRLVTLDSLASDLAETESPDDPRRLSLPAHIAEALPQQISNGDVDFLLAVTPDNEPRGQIGIMWTGPLDGTIRNYLGLQEGEYMPQVAFFEVPPSFRGQGIGSKLLKEAADMMVAREHQQLFLIVEVDNVRAQKLYGQSGYAMTTYRRTIEVPLEDGKSEIRHQALMLKNLGRATNPTPSP
jgi:ribosomal protein S18 acetylase RimI-like enzyme